MKRLILIVAAAVAARMAWAEFTAIPLGRGANASFRDDFADDRIGGFIDMGSNDLGMLPSGRRNIGGVDFEILPAATSADKSCIVLGGKQRPYLAASAKVELGEPLEAECLYLLHGSAFTSSDGNPVVGSLYVVYSDGSRERRNVRAGRDVGDWINSSRSYHNAARAWTIYNNNAQVSLFISTFNLAKGKKLSSIEFTSDMGVWFVAGVTAGEFRKVRQLASDLSIKRSYCVPDLYERPLPVYAAGSKPKNIVLFIADGMGIGALSLASNYLRRRPGALVVNQMPYAGLATTFSANADVTDSAASGTAIACGQKTRNGMVGMLPDRTPLTSVAARAHKAGFSVGILTDDAIVGATPSANYAHARSRGDYRAIAAQASECGFDIMIGQRAKEWFLPKGQADGRREDGRNLISEMNSRGYEFCETLKSFLDADSGKRVLGCFRKGEFDRETSFRELMKGALVRLSRGGRRFFMMMETGNTDGGGHSNNPESTVKGVAKAEWALSTAIDWSLSHGGDTLVVVMSDHETGALNAVVSPSTGRVSLHYGVTSHTSAPVPVCAFGPGAELFEGVYDNTDVAKRFARLLELEP
jgi:alkaline phosphatase